MPTVRPAKKNPKRSTTENAPITTKWNKAIEGRTAYWCEETKALKYKKL